MNIQVKALTRHTVRELQHTHILKA